MGDRPEPRIWEDQMLGPFSFFVSHDFQDRLPIGLLTRRPTKADIIHADASLARSLRILGETGHKNVSSVPTMASLLTNP